jgi:hypothetical protein
MIYRALGFPLRSRLNQSPASVSSLATAISAILFHNLASIVQSHRTRGHSIDGTNARPYCVGVRGFTGIVSFWKLAHITHQSGVEEVSINSTQSKSTLLTRRYQTFRGVVVRRRTFRHTVLAFPRRLRLVRKNQVSVSTLTTIGANGLIESASATGDGIESDACMRAPPLQLDLGRQLALARPGQGLDGSSHCGLIPTI